jgi:hypothetical protein
MDLKKGNEQTKLSLMSMDKKAICPSRVSRRGPLDLFSDYS